MPRKGDCPENGALELAHDARGHGIHVREIHGRFPAERFGRGVGVERLIAFIGSGFYALEITVSDGDFQEQFHRFLDTPEVVAFFDELGQYVQNLPQPGQETADMQLAAPMLDWGRVQEL